MDKTKQWGLAAGVAIVAVLVGGWFLLVSPKLSDASDVRSQVDTQEQANQQLRQRIAALQAQHKDLPQVQAELAKLGVQLPSNPALPALIRQLSNAADSAGVDLVSMAPAEPQLATPATSTASSTATDSAVDGSSTTGASSARAATPKSQLAYVPIEVVVNGGYFNVEQFVSNLEANKRLFLVTQVNAVPQSPQSGSGETAPATGQYDGHLQTTISGRVFMNAQPADASASNSAASAATK